MATIRYSLLVLLVLSTLGCQGAQQGWDEVQQQAAEATDGASNRALRSMRASLVSLQSELANARVPDSLRIESIRQQIAKIDAAIDLQELRDQVDRQVAKAKELGEHAGKSIEEVRTDLAKADESFRALQERYQAAEQSYQEASRRAAEAWAALRGH